MEIVTLLSVSFFFVVAFLCVCVLLLMELFKADVLSKKSASLSCKIFLKKNSLRIS